MQITIFGCGRLNDFGNTFGNIGQISGISHGVETLNVCFQNPFPVGYLLRVLFAGIQQLFFDTRDIEKQLIGNLLGRVFANVNNRRVGPFSRPWVATAPYWSIF